MSKIRAAQERIRQQRAVAVEAPPAAGRPAVAAPGKIAARQAAAGLEAQLAADVDALHGLTLEAKAAIKKGLVEKYRAHCEAFLAAGHQGLADPVVPYWVVWLWDTGDIEGFIRHGRRAEALNQRSPLRTPLKEFRWYRLLEWSGAELKAGRSPEPYFSQVYAEAQAMPGSIGSGYHALAGKFFVKWAEAAEQDEDREAALEHYQRARQAFETAKAVSERARVETALKQVARKLEQLGS